MPCTKCITCAADARRHRRSSRFQGTERQALLAACPGNNRTKSVVKGCTKRLKHANRS